MALGLFPALIALNIEYRGFDTGRNGLLAAMPALAGIAAEPFAPRIIDRLGALPVPSGTAAFSVLWYVGGLTGPVAAGYAMDWWNPHGMALIIAAAALATVNAPPLGSPAGR